MSAQNPPNFSFNEHNQGTILSHGDTAVNKTDKNSCLHGAYILVMTSLLTQNKIQGLYYDRVLYLLAYCVSC